MSKLYEPWIELFRKEVSDRSEEIDPEQEQDWYSLTLGWAIAKGLTVDEALGFARHIRYNTDLG